MNPVKSPLVVTFFLFVTVAALSGCVTTKTQSQAALPPKDAALITPMVDPEYLSRRSLWDAFMRGTLSLSIGAIDGTKPDTHYHNGILVKPGRHSLAVALSSCTTVPTFQFGQTTGQTTSCNKMPFKVLSFDAQAGHRYLVIGMMNNKNPVYWIEDEKTHEVVSGQRPTELIKP